MDPSRNPFAPGAGTQPPELAGRQPTIEAAAVTLDRIKTGRPDRSALLLGLRGVGKTVLLNRIAAMAEDRKYAVSLIEAPENQRLTEILAPALRRILLELDRMEGAKDKLHKALAALRSFASAFQISIGDIGVGITPEPGVADSGRLNDDLSDLLVTVGLAAAERKTAIALLIDELQYLSEKDLGALIQGLHKVAQRNLPIVLFGAGLPQLAGLTGNAKSYSERLFLFQEIGALPPNDARKAIADPITRENARIDAAALDGILEATQCYPYFIQEWGKHAWLEAAGSTITQDDIGRATPRAVNELDRSFFRVRFDRLTPTEKDYLRAMAELGTGPHRSGDIANRLGRAVEKMGPVRAKIIAKGMAYSPAHGDIDFTVPMFGDYLKRVIPRFDPRPPKKRQKPDQD